MKETIVFIIARLILPLLMATYFVSIAIFLKVNKVLFKDAKIKAIAMIVPFFVFIPLSFIINLGIQGRTVALPLLSLVLILNYIMSLRKKVIVNYLQPLVLSSLAMIMLLVSTILSMVFAVILFLFGEPTIGACAILLIFFVDAAMNWWINTSKMREFENVEYKTDVFENGESGYSTFRLPVILAVPKVNLEQKYGFAFENDPIFAFSEGRKSSSKDLGNIDVLYKVSTDKGLTWSELKTALTLGDIDGKMGNPTVVFDLDTNKLILIYLQAKKEDNYKYETYCTRATFTENLDLVFDEPSKMEIEVNENAKKGGFDGVTENTLMPGPGKCVQVKFGENKGRIVAPMSNRGASFAMYSDDHGETWQKGEEGGLGNECELTEMENGDLVLVSRDGRGCTDPHPRCFQKLSYSSDSGHTWYEQNTATELPTPICMTSIESINGKELFLAYPHDHNTRCNLHVAKSTDNGKTFVATRVYSGPAAYSCLACDSDGDLFCMAEVGAVDYNEALAFFKVKK